jgi:hypothetical protein
MEQQRQRGALNKYFRLLGNAAILTKPFYNLFNPGGFHHAGLVGAALHTGIASNVKGDAGKKVS